MSDPSTSTQIQQQREMATAVAEIAALRREHTTAMATMNETCSEIKDALKEIFAWHREMEAKHTEGVRHCSSHDAKLHGHEARLGEHDGRLRAIEARRDDSSTEELAAAVAERIAKPADQSVAAFMRPAIVWPVLVLLGMIVILAAVTNRPAKDLTPPIKPPAATTGD